jgi:NhaP-type Na+/H+ or K+/H+ antiporter
MNNLNLIVFCVGVIVSTLVVYGIFTQVVSEMYKARENERSDRTDQ